MKTAFRESKARQGAWAVVFAWTALAFAFEAAAEPKAYEVVKYRGTAAGLTVGFDFAVGYPEASELRITKAGERGGTRFVFKGDGAMRFVAEGKGAKGAEVTLELAPDDDAPAKVTGVYRAEGKTIRFRLTRQ